MSVGMLLQGLHVIACIRGLIGRDGIVRAFRVALWRTNAPPPLARMVACFRVSNYLPHAVPSVSVLA